MAIENSSLNQWLILSLESREYALPVASVVEVLRMVALRPLPEAPNWLAGVLNLRGKGIMVMDLRNRLGLQAKTPGLDSQMVIVDARGETLGLIADEVVEIITLPERALKPADQLAASPLLAAVAHAGERLILVLHLDRLAGSLSTLAGLGVVHAGN